MKLKQTFTFIAFAAAALAGLQTVKAQTTWNLAGNSNATSSSKLGTTTSTPLKLTTNNKTRVFIDAAGKDQSWKYACDIRFQHIGHIYGKQLSKYRFQFLL